MLKLTQTMALGCRLADNGDGTVTDTKTGLMWKKSSEGQAPGRKPARFTWKGAMEHAQTINSNGGFADHEDWRVPTIGELRSLTDSHRPIPAIGLSAFPDAPPDVFWSSSPVAYHSGYAWAVSFHDGDGGCSHQDDCHPVRLVRAGGQ